GRGESGVVTSREARDRAPVAQLSRPGHAEWLKQITAQELAVREARDPFDQKGEQRVSRTRVGVLLPGTKIEGLRTDPRGELRQTSRLRAPGAVVGEGVVVRDARRVGEEMPDGDLAAVGEFRDVLTQGVIEREGSAFPEDRDR